MTRKGTQVLEEVRREYMPPWRRMCAATSPSLRCPCSNLTQNALLVNALQRVSTIVAQNSLREGFGLTITEAMWKSVPVLSNSKACGPRQQLRDGVQGRLIGDPENTAEIAAALRSMLSRPKRLHRWGVAGQQPRERPFPGPYAAHPLGAAAGADSPGVRG
jgi:glycosyltransferase involved in cell wall biosynthesis